MDDGCGRGDLTRLRRPAIQHGLILPLFPGAIMQPSCMDGCIYYPWRHHEPLKISRGAPGGCAPECSFKRQHGRTWISGGPSTWVPFEPRPGSFATANECRPQRPAVVASATGAGGGAKWRRRGRQLRLSDEQRPRSHARHLVKVKLSGLGLYRARPSIEGPRRGYGDGCRDRWTGCGVRRRVGAQEGARPGRGLGGGRQPYAGSAVPAACALPARRLAGPGLTVL